MSASAKKKPWVEIGPIHIIGEFFDDASVPIQKDRKKTTRARPRRVNSKKKEKR